MRVEKLIIIKIGIILFVLIFLSSLALGGFRTLWNPWTNRLDFIHDTNYSEEKMYLDEVDVKKNLTVHGYVAIKESLSNMSMSNMTYTNVTESTSYELNSTDILENTFKLYTMNSTISGSGNLTLLSSGNYTLLSTEGRFSLNHNRFNSLNLTASFNRFYLPENLSAGDLLVDQNILVNGQWINASNANANIGGNLSLGDRIRFRLLETIDNIVDGWLRLTGNVNVTKNLDVFANATFRGEFVNVSGQANINDNAFIEGNATFAGAWLNSSGQVNVQNNLVVEGNASFYDEWVNISKNLNVGSNLTLGQKITFKLGEVFDNIVNGWLRLTGNVNVTADLDVSGNATFRDRWVNISGNLNVDKNVSGDWAYFNYVNASKEIFGPQNWTDNQNYPVECPTGAITRLGDSVTCRDYWVYWTGDTLTGNFTYWNGTVYFNGSLPLYMGVEFSLANGTGAYTYNTSYLEKNATSNLNMSGLNISNVNYLFVHNITGRSPIGMGDTRFYGTVDVLGIGICLANGTNAYTYNSTYANYSSNVSINYSVNTYNMWQEQWNSTYNLTYDNYALNVSINYSVNTYTMWQEQWNSTFNITYNALFVQNQSLWDEAWNKYNGSYLERNATTNLNMSELNITNVADLFVTNLHGGSQITFADNVNFTFDGTARNITNLNYLVADFLQGDGSGLTDLTAFNETYLERNATTNLNMSGYDITNANNLYVDYMYMQDVGVCIANGTNAYTFNDTYEGYRSNVSLNYSLNTQSMWDGVWKDTANESYLKKNATSDLNMSNNDIWDIKSLVFHLGEYIDNLVDGWLRIKGGLNVEGDGNVTGNFTSTTYYAEMWNYTQNVTAWLFPLPSTGVYYNLSNITESTVNGFTFTQEDQANGGSYFTANHAGKYRADLSITFASTVQALFGVSIAKNHDEALSRNCYTRDWVQNPVRADGHRVTCYLDLAVGDTVVVKIENEDNTADVLIHNVNLNLLRIGA